MNECRITRKERKGLKKNLDITLQSVEKCWSKSHPMGREERKEKIETKT